MPEFTRENRYIVFKISDLTSTQKQGLEQYYGEVYYQRRLHGKKPLQCLVVESDWPEYEPTWQAIEERMKA